MGNPAQRDSQREFWRSVIQQYVQRNAELLNDQVDMKQSLQSIETTIQVMPCLHQGTWPVQIVPCKSEPKRNDHECLMGDYDRRPVRDVPCPGAPAKTIKNIRHDANVKSCDCENCPLGSPTVIYKSPISDVPPIFCDCDESSPRESADTVCTCSSGETSNPEPKVNQSPPESNEDMCKCLETFRNNYLNQPANVGSCNPDNCDKLNVAQPTIPASAICGCECCFTKFKSNIDQSETTPSDELSESCSCSSKSTEEVIHQTPRNCLSNFSISEEDIKYVEKIRKLLENEKKMKKELGDLARVEKCIEQRMKRKQAYSETAGSGDFEVHNLKRLNEKLEESNNILETEIEQAVANIKHLKENVEDPIRKEIEEEKRKVRELEDEFRQSQCTQETKRLAEEKELELVRQQVQHANQYLCDLNLVNKRLKEELCMLNCRCNELQTDIINQKLSEIHTLSRLCARKRRPTKRPSGGSRGGSRSTSSRSPRSGSHESGSHKSGSHESGSRGTGSRRSGSLGSHKDVTPKEKESRTCPKNVPCPPKEPEGGDGENDLNTIARNLSNLLEQANECNTCQCAHTDLIDTVKYIKDLVDMLNTERPSSEESLPYCECGDVEEKEDVEISKDISKSPSKLSKELSKESSDIMRLSKTSKSSEMSEESGSLVSGPMICSSQPSVVGPEGDRDKPTPRGAYVESEEDEVGGKELLKLLLDYLDLQLDERGEPVLDEEGRPIATDGTLIDVKLDELGLSVGKPEKLEQVVLALLLQQADVMLDENGQPVLDEFGRPLTPGGTPIDVHIDENGKFILDERGRLVTPSGRTLEEQLFSLLLENLESQLDERYGSEAVSTKAGVDLLLDEHGEPIFDELGRLLTSDGKPIDLKLDEFGKPVVDEHGRFIGVDGKPIGKEPRAIPLGAAVPTKSVVQMGQDTWDLLLQQVDLLLDEEGHPILDEQGRPLTPAGVSILLKFDAEGKPILDEHGHLLGLSGRPIEEELCTLLLEKMEIQLDEKGRPLTIDGEVIDVLLDENGIPVKDEKGHFFTPDGRLITSETLIRVASKAAKLFDVPRERDIQLDDEGKPIVDEKGRPLRADGTPIEVKLDEYGQQVLDSQGRLQTISGHVVTPQGVVSPFKLKLDAQGKPIVDEKGRPLKADGTPIEVMLDEHGQPVLDSQGRFQTISGHSIMPERIPPPMKVQFDESGKPIVDDKGRPLRADGTPIEVKLDEHGQPVLDSQGRLQTISGHVVTPQGVVSPFKLKLDAQGKPIVDEQGRPLKADGTPIEVMLDERGQPILDSQGRFQTISGHSIMPERIPPPMKVQFDESGKPIVDEKGRPLRADGTPIEVKLDEHGQPVLDSQGRLQTISGHVVTPQGVVSPFKLQLDDQGKPIVDEQGRPLKADGTPIEVMLDEHGQPVLDSQGRFQTISGHSIMPERIPPPMKVQFDESGKPIVDEKGRPLRADGTPIEVKLDEHGQPVLDSQGRLQTISGHVVTPQGVVSPFKLKLDAQGKPIVDEQGRPLKADGTPIEVMLDEHGQPVLDSQGRFQTISGHSIMPERIPPPMKVQFDESGKPIVDEKGRPLRADGTPIEVKLDEHGQPVLDSQGRLQTISGHVVTPQGVVSPFKLKLDAQGKPIVDEQGRPLKADGTPIEVMLDEYGKPILDSQGQFQTISGHSIMPERIPPPMKVQFDESGKPIVDEKGRPLRADGTPIEVKLDEYGQPVLDSQGRLQTISGHVVTPQGVVSPFKLQLDDQGKPIVDEQGRPLKADGTPIEVMLDERGQPVLDSQGRFQTLSGHSIMPERIPPPMKVQFDESGKPIVDEKGRPLRADGTPIEVKLDEHGQPVLDSQGRLQTISGHVVTPQGVVSPFKLQLDDQGKPIVDEQGRPLKADGTPIEVMLDERGQPVLDSQGRFQTLSGHSIMPERIAPPMKVQFDEFGKPIVDEKGRPLRADGTPIEVKLDEFGQPILDAQGRLQTPSGHVVTPQGVVSPFKLQLDDQGKPIVDEQGRPLKADGTPIEVMLDEHGQPVLDSQGRFQTISGHSIMPERIAPPIKVQFDEFGKAIVDEKGRPLRADGTPIEVMLDEYGQPVLDAQGRLQTPSGHVVTPEGVVSPFKLQLDDQGKPILDEQGRPLKADGTPIEVMLDEHGQPVLDSQGRFQTISGHSIMPERIAPPIKVQFDEFGKPIVDEKGRPLKADGTPIEVMLDEDGQPVLDAQGRLQTPSGHVVTPEGIVSPFKLQLDDQGKPIVDEKGRPLKADGTPIEVMLDEHGQPVLDEQGRFQTISGHSIMPEGVAPRIKIQLDEFGKPIVDEKGRPLRADGTPIEVKLDEEGKPILDEYGRLQTLSGHSIIPEDFVRPVKLLLDESGKPIVDEKGRPLRADGTPIDIKLDEQGQPLLDAFGRLQTLSGHSIIPEDVRTPIKMLLDEHGKPVVDDKGRPLMADGTPIAVKLDELGMPILDAFGRFQTLSGHSIIPEDIVSMKLQLDKEGKPLVDQYGRPLRADGTPVEIKLDDQGQPLLDAYGRLQTLSGHSIIPEDVASVLLAEILRDEYGQPILDEEGRPLGLDGKPLDVQLDEQGRVIPKTLPEGYVPLPEAEAFMDLVDLSPEDQLRVLDITTDGTYVTTAVTSAGMLHVTTEGPAGLIDTTVKMTDSGHFQILTDMTEFEEEVIDLSGDETTTEETEHTEIDEGAEGDVARAQQGDETDEVSSEISEARELHEVTSDTETEVESVQEVGDVDLVVEGELLPVCEMEEPPVEPQVEMLMLPVCEMEDIPETPKPCVCKSDKACQCTATDESCQCEEVQEGEEQAVLPSLGVGDRENVDLSTADLDHEKARMAASEPATSVQICKPDICTSGDRGSDIKWICECKKARSTLCEECSRRRERKRSKVQLEVKISCEQPCRVIKSRTLYRESDSSGSTSSSSDTLLCICADKSPRVKQRRSQHKRKSYSNSRGVSANRSENVAVQQNYYDLEENLCVDATCQNTRTCPRLKMQDADTVLEYICPFADPPKNHNLDCVDATCQNTRTCPRVRMQDGDTSNVLENICPFADPPKNHNLDCVDATCQNIRTCPRLKMQDADTVLEYICPFADPPKNHNLDCVDATCQNIRTCPRVRMQDGDTSNVLENICPFADPPKNHNLDCVDATCQNIRTCPRVRMQDAGTSNVLENICPIADPPRNDNLDCRILDDFANVNVSTRSTGTDQKTSVTPCSCPKSPSAPNSQKGEGKITQRKDMSSKCCSCRIKQSETKHVVDSAAPAVTTVSNFTQPPCNVSTCPIKMQVSKQTEYSVPGHRDKDIPCQVPSCPAKVSKGPALVCAAVSPVNVKSPTIPPDTCTAPCQKRLVPCIGIQPAVLPMDNANSVLVDVHTLEPSVGKMTPGKTSKVAGKSVCVGPCRQAAVQTEMSQAVSGISEVIGEIDFQCDPFICPAKVKAPPCTCDDESLGKPDVPCQPSTCSRKSKRMISVGTGSEKPSEISSRRLPCACSQFTEASSNAQRSALPSIGKPSIKSTASRPPTIGKGSPGFGSAKSECQPCTCTECCMCEEIRSTKPPSMCVGSMKGSTAPGSGKSDCQPCTCAECCMCEEIRSTRPPSMGVGSIKGSTAPGSGKSECQPCTCAECCMCEEIRSTRPPSMGVGSMKGSTAPGSGKSEVQPCTCVECCMCEEVRSTRPPSMGMGSVKGSSAYGSAKSECHPCTCPECCTCEENPSAVACETIVGSITLGCTCSSTGKHIQPLPCACSMGKESTGATSQRTGPLAIGDTLAVQPRHAEPGITEPPCGVCVQYSTPTADGKAFGPPTGEACDKSSLCCQCSQSYISNSGLLCYIQELPGIREGMPYCDTDHSFGVPPVSGGETVRSPGGTVRSPGGTLRSPGGTVRSPGGTVRSPGGTVRSPGGTVHSPGGTVRSPGGTVRSPGGTLLSAAGTPGQVSAPKSRASERSSAIRSVDLTTPYEQCKGSESILEDPSCTSRTCDLMARTIATECYMTCGCPQESVSTMQSFDNEKLTYQHSVCSGECVKGICNFEKCRLSYNRLESPRTAGSKQGSERISSRPGGDEGSFGSDRGSTRTGGSTRSGGPAKRRRDGGSSEVITGSYRYESGPFGVEPKPEGKRVDAGVMTPPRSPAMSDSSGRHPATGSRKPKAAHSPSSTSPKSSQVGQTDGRGTDQDCSARTCKRLRATSSQISCTLPTCQMRQQPTTRESMEKPGFKVYSPSASAADRLSARQAELSPKHVKSPSRTSERRSLPEEQVDAASDKGSTKKSDRGSKVEPLDYGVASPIKPEDRSAVGSIRSSKPEEPTGEVASMLSERKSPSVSTRGEEGAALQQIGEIESQKGTPIGSVHPDVTAESEHPTRSPDVKSLRSDRRPEDAVSVSQGKPSRVSPPPSLPRSRRSSQGSARREETASAGRRLSQPRSEQLGQDETRSADRPTSLPRSRRTSDAAPPASHGGTPSPSQASSLPRSRRTSTEGPDTRRPDDVGVADHISAQIEGGQPVTQEGAPSPGQVSSLPRSRRLSSEGPDTSRRPDDVVGVADHISAQIEGGQPTTQEGAPSPGQVSSLPRSRRMSSEGPDTTRRPDDVVGVPDHISAQIEGGQPTTQEGAPSPGQISSLPRSRRMSSEGPDTTRRPDDVVGVADHISAQIEGGQPIIQEGAPSPGQPSSLPRSRRMSSEGPDTPRRPDVLARAADHVPEQPEGDQPIAQEGAPSTGQPSSLPRSRRMSSEGPDTSRRPDAVMGVAQEGDRTPSHRPEDSRGISPRAGSITAASDRRPSYAESRHPEDQASIPQGTVPSTDRPRELSEGAPASPRAEAIGGEGVAAPGIEAATPRRTSIEKAGSPSKTPTSRRDSILKDTAPVHAPGSEAVSSRRESVIKDAGSPRAPGSGTGSSRRGSVRIDEEGKADETGRGAGETVSDRGSRGPGSSDKLSSKLPVPQDRPHPVGCHCQKCNYSICECTEQSDVTKVPCALRIGKGHPPNCVCIDCICDPSRFEKTDTGDVVPVHPPDCACVDCLCDPKKVTSEIKGIAHKVPCDCAQCICSPCADEDKPRVCASFLPPHHPDCDCPQCLCEECIHVPDCQCAECLCEKCPQTNLPKNKCNCIACICAPCGDTEADAARRRDVGEDKGKPPEDEVMAPEELPLAGELDQTELSGKGDADKYEPEQPEPFVADGFEDAQDRTVEEAVSADQPQIMPAAYNLEEGDKTEQPVSLAAADDTQDTSHLDEGVKTGQLELLAARYDLEGIDTQDTKQLEEGVKTDQPELSAAPDDLEGIDTQGTKQLEEGVKTDQPELLADLGGIYTEDKQQLEEGSGKGSGMGSRRRSDDKTSERAGMSQEQNERKKSREEGKQDEWKQPVSSQRRKVYDDVCSCKEGREADQPQPLDADDLQGADTQSKKQLEEGSGKGSGTGSRRRSDDKTSERSGMKGTGSDQDKKSDKKREGEGRKGGDGNQDEPKQPVSSQRRKVYDDECSCKEGREADQQQPLDADDLQGTDTQSKKQLEEGSGKGSGTGSRRRSDDKTSERSGMKGMGSDQDKKSDKRREGEGRKGGDGIQDESKQPVPSQRRKVYDDVCSCEEGTGSEADKESKKKFGKLDELGNLDTGPPLGKVHPDCQCLECACDECLVIPECECDSFECDNCADEEMAKKKREAEIRKDGGVESKIAEWKEKIVEHPVECNCTDCRCNPCRDKAAEERNRKRREECASGIEERDCDCWFCMCKNCRDPKIRAVANAPISSIFTNWGNVKVPDITPLKNTITSFLKHKSDCKCYKCSCDPCKADPFKSYVTKLHGPDCTCPGCCCKPCTVLEEAKKKKEEEERKKKECNCDRCVCDPCGDPIFHTKRTIEKMKQAMEKHRPNCDCPVCRCDPCKDPKHASGCKCPKCACDPCSKMKPGVERKSAVEPTAAATHGPECDCEVCRCQPCASKVHEEKVLQQDPFKNDVLTPMYKEHDPGCQCVDCLCKPCFPGEILSRVHGPSCDCADCLCKPCFDDNIKSRALSSQHPQNCKCPECLCKPSFDENIKPIALSVQHGPSCNCPECLCERCFDENVMSSRSPKKTHGSHCKCPICAPPSAKHGPSCQCPECFCKPCFDDSIKPSVLSSEHPPSCKCVECSCKPCFDDSIKPSVLSSEHPKSCKCPECLCKPSFDENKKPITLSEQHGPSCKCPECLCERCFDENVISSRSPKKTHGSHCKCPICAPPSARHGPSCQCPECFCKPCFDDSIKPSALSSEHPPSCKCVECSCKPCFDDSIKPSVLSSGHPKSCKCPECLCKPSFDENKKPIALSEQHGPSCNCPECLCERCFDENVKSSRSPKKTHGSHCKCPICAPPSARHGPSCQCPECFCKPCFDDNIKPAVPSTQHRPSCTCPECLCKPCFDETIKPSGLSTLHGPTCACPECECERCFDESVKSKKSSKDNHGPFCKCPICSPSTTRHGPSCQCPECLCKPCFDDSIKRTTLSAQHGPSCQCPECLCKPCFDPNVKHRGSTKESHGPKCKCPICAPSPVRHGPSCQCPECLCKPCFDENVKPFRSTKESHGQTCECPECLCKPCFDDKIQPMRFTKESHGQTCTCPICAPLPAQHEPSCQCPECSCNPCFDERIQPIKSTKESHGQTCQCPICAPLPLEHGPYCQCIECLTSGDATMRPSTFNHGEGCLCPLCVPMRPFPDPMEEMNVDKMPDYSQKPPRHAPGCKCRRCMCEACQQFSHSLMPPKGKHSRHCKCDVCACVPRKKKDKSKTSDDPTKKKKPRTHAKSRNQESLAKTTKCPGCDCSPVCVCDTCPVKNKQMAPTAKVMDDDALKKNIRAAQQENLDRRKEIEELEALMEQIRCSCDNAEVEAARTYCPVKLLDLQNALKDLEEKCQNKDKIIEAMADELRLREPAGKPQPASAAAAITSSAPLLNIKEVKRISSDSVIVKWSQPINASVVGYEISVDNVVRSRVHSAQRTCAVVFGLQPSTKALILVHAVTQQGRCEPPATYQYN